MAKLVTKDSLQAMIENADADKRIKIIGRALVHLFNRQEKSEKEMNDTHLHNARGFTPADARSGCISAKSYIGKKTLQPWVVEMWMKKNAKGDMRIAKYWSQLNEVANEVKAA